ncbi:hypothetical protein KBY55_08640 [Streptomyces sp. b94]|uniref:hypothetical protein n=1 Tax=Streptomyces sp. b94 TaxID=1827634 RepID=UPI001B3933A5|nr:hypothetical protein [Streptomyces sp. b94]MBQ1096155.1 hypothetical protein [Streptomyces sp. b94]
MSRAALQPDRVRVARHDYGVGWLALLAEAHGTASGDPYRAGAALARLRRLFDSPVAAAAFAEQYLGARTGG